MVNVAVAGGFGHLGRTIVEALQKSPKHSIIMLAREVTVFFIFSLEHMHQLTAV